jgi:hypothetical protein
MIELLTGISALGAALAAVPAGFMKIRYYGFLHPSSHIPLELAVTLLEAGSGFRSQSSQLETDQNSGPFCPECSGPVRLLYFMPPRTVIPAAAGFS